MSLACPYCDATYESAYTATESTLAACVHCMNPFAIVPEAGQATATRLSGHVDLRQSVPADSLGGKALASVQKNIDTLPVLPEIALRVISLCNDPEVSVSDLAALIAQDPSMAGKVLQVSNSAMYGGLKSISTLDAACVRLGLRNTANIVQAVANARVFTSSDPALSESMKALWRHSLVAAQSAFEVARLVSDPQPDSLYLAALFHDIGRVAIIDRVSRAKDATMVQLRTTPELLQEVLDGFGSLVGLHAIQRWGLSNAFRVAVFYGEKPESALDAWLRIAHITAISSALADAAGYPGNGSDESHNTLVGLPSATFLSLSDIKMAALRVDLEDRLAEWVDLLSQ